jgi:chondroitin 4-sulfotransferase 11
MSRLMRFGISRLVQAFDSRRPLPFNANPRLVFIHIPKTGGISVRAVLDPPFYRNNDIMGPLGTASVKKAQVAPARWERACRFCFARNPWSRAVSIYFFLNRIRQEGKREALRFEELFDRSFVDDPFSHPSLDRFESWHVTSQLFHLRDPGGNVVVPLVGRFERLQQDFDDICRLVGLPIQNLPHKNATNHGDFLSYYDGPKQRLIATYYGEDIDYFKYRFEG